MTALLKPVLAAALLLAHIGAHIGAQVGAQIGQTAPSAPPDHLRYQRSVLLPPARLPQACATLDAQVFAHAAPSLKDLRLFNGTAELPYATTLSQPLQQESDDARVLNLGLRTDHNDRAQANHDVQADRDAQADYSGHAQPVRLVFDLAMPPRPYTDIQLNLARTDFLATATVAGEPAPNAPARTHLGTFTLFDLSRQHLSRSTSLPLPESTFPFLHIELTLTPVPGTPALPLTPAILQGATVPPSREAQTLYTTAARTTTFTTRGHQTLATFTLPIHVPIERVSFDLAPGFQSNFSRTVHLVARAASTPSDHLFTTHADQNIDPDPPTADPPAPETLTAAILRVHTTEAGHPLDHDQLSIPVSIGSNMQRPATLQIAIDNGDDPPLPLAAIRLEMRQRSICFDPTSVTAQTLTLEYGDDYGDPAATDYAATAPTTAGNSAASPDPYATGPAATDPDLQPPVYDYAKLFRPVANPEPAYLQPEHLNPAFQPRPDPRPLSDRHPALLWIVLLGVLILLATVALRSARSLLR
jgi:hypothetical protein